MDFYAFTSTIVIPRIIIFVSMDLVQKCVSLVTVGDIIEQFIYLVVIEGLNMVNQGFRSCLSTSYQVIRRSVLPLFFIADVTCSNFPILRKGNFA